MNVSTPLVTVVIPTKNRLNLLRATLASVLDQTLADWEAIVVDDGSTDGSKEWVESIASKEGRVRFVSRMREPSGAPTCRNIGLENARGEFVLFLDSDDLLARSCLESRVRELQAKPELDFVVGEAEKFETVPGDSAIKFGGGEERHDFLRCLSMHYPWQTTGPLWRRKIFAQMGGWDEELSIGQDVDLTTRALAFAFPYRRLHRQDYFYRMTPGGLGSGKMDAKHLQSHFRRVTRACELLSKRGLLQGRARDCMAGNFLWIAQHFAALGDQAEARKVWRAARENGAAGFLNCTVGRVLLLQGRKVKYLRMLIPLAVFVLPPGYLIHPESSDMSPRFIDGAGEYLPVHYPETVRDFVAGGNFSYWLWFTGHLGRLRFWRRMDVGLAGK